MAKKKSINRARTNNFFQRVTDNPKKLLLATGIIFALSALLAWWQFVFASPDAVLYGAVKNSLSTSGVVKNLEQKSEAGTVVEKTYLSFSGTPTVQRQLKQEYSAPGTPFKSITQEFIGTTKNDYARYGSIDLALDSDEQKYNNILGVWGKSGEGVDGSQEVSVLNQALFSIIPFADMSDKDAEILKQFVEDRNVYQYSSVRKSYEGIRPVYEYEAVVNVPSLVEYWAKYAEKLSIDHKGQLNPENYAGVPPAKLKFKIDVLTRQVKIVELVDVNKFETYSSFGLKRPIEIPGDSVPISELQGRLQKLQ